MTIDLLFITYNRLDYTRASLASVLADPTERFSLTIWDNASTDGTVEFLKREVSDPRVARVVYSDKNVGQIEAINTIWGESTADLVGKLDNDCLVTPGWTRTLAQAHRDVDELGVVACWHFFPEDFDYQRAAAKIHSYGRHRILRHPWTCGTGMLVKRRTFERVGPMRGSATTDYWFRLAKAGCVNGFYYPLVHQENMDDPRSTYCRLKQLPFEQAYEHSHGWKTGAITDEESTRQLQARILETLLTGSYNPYFYRPETWTAGIREGLAAGRRRVDHWLRRVPALTRSSSV